MSFRELDRTQVRSRDLILEDGQAYDQHNDPWILAARNMLKDIESYKQIGETPQLDGLRVRVGTL